MVMDKRCVRKKVFLLDPICLLTPTFHNAPMFVKCTKSKYNAIQNLRDSGPNCPVISWFVKLNSTTAKGVLN